ncbi:conserved hypothetical protein [Gammaproteobacteria bacterium]
MAIRTLQYSFAGGELTNEFFGRIDDAKYRSGLARCRNFIVKPHGPVENRAGFAFVREGKYSDKNFRLIPFTYLTTQTMIIEMGEGYFRFHTEGKTLLYGGAPYEITNPYLESELPDIRYVQSADVLTLVHWNQAPRELRRYGAKDWRLSVISFIPTITPPVTLSLQVSHDDVNDYEYSYGVTAITKNRLGESELSTPVKHKNNLFATGHWNKISWDAVTGAGYYRVYKLQSGVYGYIGETADLELVDDNISADIGITPPLYDKTFTYGGISSVAVVNGGHDYGLAGNGILAVDVLSYGSYIGLDIAGTSDNDYSIVITDDGDGDGASLGINWQLDESGNRIGYSITVVDQGASYHTPTITLRLNGVDINSDFSVHLREESTNPTLKVVDSTGSGAELSTIVENGVIVGVNVINPGIGYTEPTVEIDDDMGGDGAIFEVEELVEVCHPGAVSYFEQRRCFAGARNFPQNIWMTKSGTESNMSYSLPVRDDDRISFRVAAREANTILHIVPLGQLVLLTAAAEWLVTSVNSDAITPTSISVRPQSYVGASNVQPVIVNNSLIYGAARGGHVREMAYSWQAGGFITGDLSLRAPHLFDGYTIRDLAYAKAPQPLIWMVRSDGKLLGLTYIPEQQVGAWHQHDTVGGSFESCAVVAEGDDDILYVVVKRTINGQVKRYIERLVPRRFDAQRQAFFVDCGATYSGAPATIISGLDHLEGKTVSILADGLVHPHRTVHNGRITLQSSASKVQVGLPITSELQTLPVAVQLDGSLGQGHTKNVNKAWLRVYRSGGIAIGPDTEHLTEAKWRSTSLESEEIQVSLPPSWGNSGQIFVRQTDPLPLTILNLTLEVAVGG